MLSRYVILVFYCLTESKTGIMANDNQTTTKKISEECAVLDEIDTFLNSKTPILPKTFSKPILNSSYEEIPHSYPFMASLETTSRFILCSAVLITPYTVISSCHCIVQVDRSGLMNITRLPIYVIAGREFEEEHLPFYNDNLWENYKRIQYRKATDIIAHPKCIASKKHWPYNIAAINIDVPFRVNRCIRPIKIPKYFNLERYERGTNCEYIAWDKKGKLGIVPMFKMDITSCAKFVCKTYNVCNITEKLDVCYLPKDENMLTGSSGGPITCKKHLFGIVSWSPKKVGKRRSPTIFFKIDGDVEFLNLFLNDARKLDSFSILVFLLNFYFL